MSLAACIIRWPTTHPLAVLPVPALAHAWLQDRSDRLFDLQEEGIMRVAPLKQNDERLAADAANADHLVGHVDDLEAIEQAALVLAQGRPVGLELLADHPVEVVGGGAGQGGQVARRDHDRRLADDPVPPVDQLAELGQRLQAVAGVRLLAPLRGLLRLLGSLLRLFPCCSRPLRRRLRQAGDAAAGGRHHLVLVQMGVPDVHRPHLREAGHRLPVGGDRSERRLVCVRLREPVVAGGDGEAGRHPLDVVLERPRQGLVEVVQVEQQPPLGRGERAEVRQVRVPAQLGLQPGYRRDGEVGGHDRGRAPVEGERRDHHPAMPHRHQARRTDGILLLEQRDRVGPVRGRAPPGMAPQRGPLPGC
jgi:hypothetical protein